MLRIVCGIDLVVWTSLSTEYGVLKGTVFACVSRCLDIIESLAAEDEDRMAG